VPAFVLWRTARSETTASSLAQVDAGDLRQLVMLGGALMVVGWLGQLSAYAVRLAIVRQEGLDAAGYYQAAYAISGSLPGFVFVAMGADFFPRVAASKDEKEAIDITRIQIQAGLILGVPLIALLLLFGEESVRILYTTGLDPAATLLPWMAWAVFLRVVSWPLGFWLMARGKPSVVVGLETGANLFLVITSLFLTQMMGAVGAAIAMLLAGALYLSAMVVMVYCKTCEITDRRTLVTILVAALILSMAHLLGWTHLHLVWRIIFAASLGGLSAWAYSRATTPRPNIA
jgi:O-antigen/teichoic acid export membrane protein